MGADGGSGRHACHEEGCTGLAKWLVLGDGVELGACDEHMSELLDRLAIGRENPSHWRRLVRVARTLRMLPKALGDRRIRPFK